MTGALSETVAEFQYTEYAQNDSDTTARSGTAPSTLGLSISHAEGDDEESRSVTTAMLVDVNDACMEQAVEECENSGESDRSEYIAETKETGGMYDMNGDGLSDMVVAGRTMWQVYFNNGYDFENPVSWPASSRFISKTDEGRPEID